MKVFLILPDYLPDPLLARQHQTLHAVMNGVLARKPRRGITRFLRFGGFVVWLHYRCVIEMRRRGWDHNTRMAAAWARLPADQRRFDYPVDARAVAADVALVLAKQRSGRYTSAMSSGGLPPDLAGLKLVEALRTVALTGQLPDGALTL